MKKMKIDNVASLAVLKPLGPNFRGLSIVNVTMPINVNNNIMPKIAEENNACKNKHEQKEGHCFRST